MTREQVAQQYYESPEGLTLPLYMAASYGVLETETPTLMHAEVLDPAAVAEKLDEISQSLMVVEYKGSFFEIAVANWDVPDDDVMLHISTFSSSITGNAGNAYEFAAQAVRYPHKRQVYVASFGNGGTSRLLTHKERRYAAQSGKFTWEMDGQTVPLPSVQNMFGALEKAGLSVTRIMGSDSAGGSYATALGLAMPKDQLTHVFFSERAGFVNLSVIQIVRGILLKETLINRKQNQKLSPDPQKLTADKIEQAKQALAAHKDLPNRRELSEKIVPLPLSMWNMWPSMQALRRGPYNGCNPLIEDTNLMLNRHPSMDATFGLAEQDPLYKNPETARKAAQDFLSKIVLQNGIVQIIMIPEMTHAYNTDFPSLNHALKRYALEL